MDKSSTTPSTTALGGKPLPSRSPASINNNSSKKKQQRLDDIFANRSDGSPPSNTTSPPQRPTVHTTVASSKTEAKASEDGTPRPLSSFSHTRPAQPELATKPNHVRNCSSHPTHKKVEEKTRDKQQAEALAPEVSHIVYYFVCGFCLIIYVHKLICNFVVSFTTGKGSSRIINV